MRRIAIYRAWDDQEIAAQIGPDPVMGIAGFGKTVEDAVRNLAYWMEKHHYELRGNCIGVEVAETFVEVQGRPSESSSFYRATSCTTSEGRTFQAAKPEIQRWPESLKLEQARFTRFDLQFWF